MTGIKVRNSGAMVTPTQMRLRNGGAWIDPTKIWLRDAGAWVQEYPVGGPPPGAPSYNSYGFTSSTAWNNFAGPPVVDLGDLLLCFIVVDETQTALFGGATTWPTMSGWTPLGSGAVSAGGDCSGFGFWKIAGAGDVATGTPVTYSSPDLNAAPSSAGSATIIRITGAHASAPIDGSTLAITSSGATSVTMPAITTTVANTLLVSWAGSDESSSSYDPYWAVTSGWTAIIGTSGTPSGQGASATYIGAQWKTQASAGSTGTVTFNVAAQNDALVGYLVAIKPA